MRFESEGSLTGFLLVGRTTVRRTAAGLVDGESMVSDELPLII